MVGGFYHGLPLNDLIVMLLCLPYFPRTYPVLSSSVTPMSRPHVANRSVAQWVAWAQSEGFEDIAKAASDGTEVPGKVYCKLCAKTLCASASTIKQHSVGYFEGKGDDRKFHESMHAAKVKKRAARAADTPAMASQPNWIPPTIVVQVCGTYCAVNPSFSP